MTLDSGRLFVRTDASPASGGGHFMRCFAIAQHWRDLGREVCFIGSCPAVLADRLGAEGIRHVPVRRPHPDRADVELTSSLVSPQSPAVLDGYHFDPDYQARLASAVGRLLVIDDNGHWPAYAGDVLLNPNLHATRIGYREAPALRLLGPRYALLAREFRVHGRSEAVSPSATRILVTFGAGATAGRALDVMEILARRASGDRMVRVVGGSMNSRLGDLESWCRANVGFELAPRAASMAESMAWADLAIASAGGTALELATMGVPSILLAVADNQARLGRALDSSGAATYLGRIDALDAGRFVLELERLAEDPAARRRMSRRGRSLVDGRGVIRVGAALEASDPVPEDGVEGLQVGR